MDALTACIALLRSIPGVEFGPPATEASIAAFESRAGHRLPQGLRRLYLDHDGVSPCPAANSFRLLSLDELFEEQYGENVIRASFPYPIAWAFGDDNSNYVGEVISGPMSGSIIILDHDVVVPFRPQFRCLETFLLELVNLYRYQSPWHYMRLELPRLEEFEGGDFFEGDNATANELLAEATSEVNPGRAMSLLFCYMAFLPYHRTNELIPLVDHEDFFVAEQAVILLGQRRWAQAIPTLEREIIAGRQNVGTAAVSAMKKMPVSLANPALSRCLKSAPETIRTFIQNFHT